MRHILTALAANVLVAALFTGTPALAVTNLIKNGSFEAGNPGTGGFTNWTKANIPANAPASIISYNIAAPYPTGAFGEIVFADNAVSLSPDAAGAKAAYFVGDFSVNETISQLVYLTPGNYQVGFSYFLTQNGLNNIGNASFDARILGVPIASTNIVSGSPSRVWTAVNGVVGITQAGHYDVAFSFNSKNSPSKDIVIDRVYAFASSAPAEFLAGTPSAIPEPASWAMLIAGFGLVGIAARKRRSAFSAVIC